MKQITPVQEIWLVVSPHLKNMLVKLDHETPSFRGNIYSKIFELPPPIRMRKGTPKSGRKKDNSQYDDLNQDGSAIFPLNRNHWNFGHSLKRTSPLHVTTVSAVHLEAGDQIQGILLGAGSRGHLGTPKKNERMAMFL